MGKGSRNRDVHIQERTDNPKKYQAPKKAPKWVKPAVSIVLLVAVLFGAVAWIVAANGIVERNRVIVKSESGKYDLTQQMATYLVWQNMYSTYYSLSEYYLSSSTSSSTSSEEKELQKLQFALQYAQMSVQDGLRDSIESSLDKMVAYVALCDKAYEDGFGLDDADKETIDEQVEWLWNIKEAIGYYAASKNKFLSVITVAGMKEKDVRAALELMTLAEKFKMDYQTKLDAGLAKNPEIEAILAGYRDENLADFYTAKYLSYVSENKALAEKLATATTVEQFQEILIQEAFNDQYGILFNRYTTQEDAKAALALIEGKKNNENGSAWTDGINKIQDEFGGWTEAKTYANDSTFTLPVDIKDWMFSDLREQFDTFLVTTLDKDDNVVVYLVAVDEIADLGKSVKAHVKSYPAVSGESHDGKDNFKQLVYDYVKHVLMDTEKPEVDYKSADDKANDLKTKLSAEGANVTEILAGIDGLKSITASSTAAEKKAVPSVVTKAVEKAAKVGAIVAELDFDTSYLIYVSKVENKTYEYSYVSLESDLFYRVGDELVEGLEETFPTEKSISYTAKDDDDTKQTFAEWASELSADEKLPFVRQNNEAKWFEEKENVKGDDGKDKTDANGNVITKTVYAAYIIKDTMGFDTKKDVFQGGYISQTDAAAAESLKASLSGKTYSELVFELYVEGATTSYDKAFDAASITDKNVKAWFESADRKANEVAVITGADNKSYVVAFVAKQPEWKAKASAGYVAQERDEWVKGLSSKYTPNEKALNKIGEKTTTTAAQ